MMKALNGLDMEISLCNRMSLLSVLHHKDRSVPSSCQITSLQVSLFFVIFPYFSLSFNCYEICSNYFKQNDKMMIFAGNTSRIWFAALILANTLLFRQTLILFW